MPLTFLKNKIKTARFFWQYRHWIDRSVWDVYSADFRVARRDAYAKFVVDNKIESIFEFGCASAPNFRNIEDNNFARPAICIGYDINKAALRTARKTLPESHYYFVSEISQKRISDLLALAGLQQLDLAIYDRVLYLLSEDKLKRHLDEFYPMMRFVIIDDFHCEKEWQTNGAYQTKDYRQIMRSYGFRLLTEDRSMHAASEDFFKNYARRLTFQRGF
ncbi:hypothetical protein OAO72_00270 [Alphaproteobacteria bacterium]|nr:hypothetical protein [Alphaproteobacteria bacterium]